MEMVLSFPQCGREDDPVSTPGQSGARRCGSGRTFKAAPPRIGSAPFCARDAGQRAQSGAARARSTPAWTPDDGHRQPSSNDTQRFS